MNKKQRIKNKKRGNLKKISVNILLIILLILVVNTSFSFNFNKNFAYTNTETKKTIKIATNAANISVYNQNDNELTSDGTSVNQTNHSVSPDSNSVGSLFTFPGTGFIGLFLSLIRLIIILVIFTFELLVNGLMMLGVGGPILSIDAVIFGKLNIINLKFLTQTTAASYFLGDTKEVVAGLAQALFLIVIGAELVILTLIAIKGIIENATGKGGGKGKYRIKEGLLLWLKSFLILFGIHFVAFFILKVNETFVEAFSKSVPGLSDVSNSKGIDGVIRDTLLNEIKTFSVSLKFDILLLLYLVLKVQALVMYVYYIRRALRILVQILSAPLVAINTALAGLTNSKDGLSKWVSNFIGTVFIQSIHAFLYITLVGTVLSTASSLQISGNSNFLGAVAQIIPMVILMFGIFKFIYYADDYFEKYFTRTSGTERIGTSAGVLVGYSAKAMGTVKNVTKKFKEFNDKKIRSRVMDTTKDPSLTPDTTSDGTSNPETGSPAPNTPGSGSATGSPSSGTGNDSDKPKDMDNKEKEKSKLRQKLDEILDKSGIKDNVIVKGLMEKNPIKLRKKEEKDYKKNVKRINKLKKDKPVKRLAKLAVKNGVKGFTYIAMQSATKSYVNFNAANQTGDAVYDFGEQSQKAVVQYNKLRKSPEYIKFTLTKEQSKVAYYDKTTEYAYEQTQMAKRIEILYGEEIDLSTPEGRQRLDDIIRTLLARDAGGALEKEYENAQKEFVKELVKTQNIDAFTARAMVDEFEKKIAEANDLEVGGLTQVQRDFVTAMTEKQQVLMVKEYNDISKKVKDKIDLDDNYLVDKDKPKSLQLSYYNNILDLIEYNEENDIAEEENRKEKEKLIQRNIEFKKVEAKSVLDKIKKEWNK